MEQKPMDVITSRRSIRRYRPEPLNEAVYEQMLRAAMSAPSAHNQQPWAFIVIDDRNLLDAIPEFHPYSKMLKEAPAAILVCGDLRNLKAEDYWPQDCSAATQNILLAANALGLGSVWMGVYPTEPLVNGMRDLLSIPADFVPFSLIAIGHPVEAKQPSDRYDPERVHHNFW